jgi:hypothetical protein
MKIKASGRSALIVAAGIWIYCSGPLQAQESTGQAQAASGTEQPVALGKPIALNKYSKRHSRHGKRHASSHSRKHSRTARSESKSSRHADDAKTAESKTAESKSKIADSKAKDAKAAEANQAMTPDANQKVAAQPNPATKDEGTSATLSSSVANARAQLLSSHATVGAASTLVPAPATTLNDASPSPPQTAANANVVPPDELNEVDRSLSDNNKQPTPSIAMASISTSPAPTATVSNNDSTWTQTSLIGKIFIAFGGLLTLASAARMLIA